MTDRFDVPTLDDDEESPPAADDAQVVDSGFDVPDLDADPVAAGPSSDPTLIDYLLAGADGASLNHGKWGQQIGDWLAGDRPEGAEVVGGGVMDQVPDTAGTKAARVGGALATGIPASIAAGPSVGAQALLGGATGAASAHGRGEDMIGGAALGALLSGGLAGAAKGATAVSGHLAKRLPLPPTPPPAPLPKQLSLLAPPPPPPPVAPAVAPTVADDFVAQLAQRAPKGVDAFLSPGKTAYNAALQGGVRVAERAGKAAGPLRAAGQMSAQAAGYLGDEVSPISKASAQDRPAATQQWAVQSVLYRGNSGLPPEAERRLTAAAMSGDPEKIATENFLLSSKYPAYRDSYRKTINKLSEGDD